MNGWINTIEYTWNIFHFSKKNSNINSVMSSILPCFFFLLQINKYPLYEQINKAMRVYDDKDGYIRFVAVQVCGASI